jgi:hypothetical protein
MYFLTFALSNRWVECATRSRAFAGEDSSQGVDIRIHGIGQRTSSNSSIQEFPLSSVRLIGTIIFGQTGVVLIPLALYGDDTELKHIIYQERKERVQGKR